ncbi:MAG: DUF368 domain-containing protein [Pseudomonadota bacterium]|nr:DUF368 domain-containing protein [Pseudomonadota bacterium]
MANKPLKASVLLFLKGMAMGAADIVPGVSGGTVAFITGIYEKLVDSIGAIGPQTIRVLLQQGPVAAWHSFNGNFLLLLFAGILTSVFTLSSLISGLLQQHPQLLWAFFFGLILASAVHIGRQIPRWGPATGVALVLGAGIAYGITTVSPQELPLTPLTLFLAGSIAICAMVLPGVSGSFILLLLGMYGHVIGAVKGLQLGNLALFSAGCVLGLLLFTRLLSWLLHHYHALTLALLTGFMLGSLNKVWPWKQTLTTRVNSHGERVPLDQANLWPQNYELLTGQDPQLTQSIALMLLAAALVLLLEWLARPKNGAGVNHA